MPAGATQGRRPEALEKQKSRDPFIVLEMPDGSTVSIPGGIHHMFRLSRVAAQEPASPEDQALSDMLRRCTVQRIGHQRYRGIAPRHNT
jgi:hypothetical protein